MRLQKVLAGVMVAAITIMVVPVSSVKGADGVPIDEEHFPDEVFRSYVSESFDNDRNGSLSDEEINMIYIVSVDYSETADLTGIEYFTFLTELDCTCSHITTLDVSRNTALNVLKCFHNELTSLNVSGCAELTKLECGSNELTMLDVSNNTALTELCCDRNQLSTLGVSNNMALEDLDCRDNQLSTLDVSNNIALTRLWCAGNEFSEVALPDGLDLDNLETDGQIDKENRVLIVAPNDEPILTPNKTINVGDKVIFKAKKKVASVEGFVPGEIVSVKKKGKKVIVTGVSAGTVTVMAYNKKGKELGSWVVKVE